MRKYNANQETESKTTKPLFHILLTIPKTLGIQITDFINMQTCPLTNKTKNLNNGENSGHLCGQILVK